MMYITYRPPLPPGHLLYEPTLQYLRHVLDRVARVEACGRHGNPPHTHLVHDPPDQTLIAPIRWP